MFLSLVPLVASDLAELMVVPMPQHAGMTR